MVLLLVAPTRHKARQAGQAMSAGATHEVNVAVGSRRQIDGNSGINDIVFECVDFVAVFIITRPGSLRVAHPLAFEIS